MSRWIGALVVGATLAVAGCGKSGGDVAAPEVPKTMVVSLDRSAVTIIAGRRDSVTATVTTTGKITGTISYAVEGLPSGITGTATPRTTSGATVTATVLIDVAATVAPGTYPLTVRSTTPGVTDATVTGTITVQPIPAIALSVDSATRIVNQGASVNTVVTLARTNFTGPVTLAVANLPTGVTATFDSSTVGGTRATLTLTAATNAALGAAALTVQASGTGITAVTAPLTLTVNPAPAYTLAASPTTVSIDQGGTASATLTLARTNFSGAVSFAAQTLPTGVTATFTPTSTTGASATVQFTATTTAAAGSSTVTIRATAAGLADRTVSLPITVNPLLTGSVDFTGCLAADRAVWLAMQDGDGGVWTRVTGTGDVYPILFKGTRVAYAYATNGSSTNGVTVRYHTRAEVSGQVLRPCTPTVAGTQTVTGTLANASGSAALFFGGGVTGLGANGPTQANGTFTIANVRPGRHDFLAYTGLARGIIIRDINPGNGGSVGTIDFGSTNPTRFSLTARQATATNTRAGETYAFFERYFTTTADYVCEEIPLNSVTSSGANFAVYGVPAPYQATTDFYQVVMRAVTFDGTRQVAESFQDFTTRTANPFVLPAPLLTPTVTELTGATMRRLQAVATGIPAEYDGPVTLTTRDALQTRRITLVASAAWRNGTSVTLAIPDLTGVAGWTSSWVPPGDDVYRWTLEASNTPRSNCTDGARVITATVTGGTAAQLRR
jgi:hypothetical protein